MNLCEPVSGAARPFTLKRYLPLSFSIRRWLREPLAHFLLIGLGLFAMNGVLNPASQGVSSRRIELTVDDIRQLQLAFTAQWRRPPAPQEMAGLVNNKFNEEILYREALALGLDKEDTIVKRRMAQKMEFLAEDTSTAREPGMDELKAWFDTHSERFTVPGRATFRHLYFSFDQRHEHARHDAAQALRNLVGRPANPSALADPFMFQDHYADRSAEQLSKEFGPTFARALFQLKSGSWQGPIESGYGWHLVWVDSITPGRVPAFEEVQSDVKSEWIARQREASRQKSIEAMRARYQLVLPLPATKKESQ